MSYQSRIVDFELKSRLAATGAVVVEGARGCGKTSTARQLAASEILLDIDENARQLIEMAPDRILGGAAPRLIDEWQLEPRIWNHIRRAVDDRGKPGQFILTGSAIPADDITRHSGAGRITRLHMRPMTLFETGISSGDISLANVLTGSPVDADSTDLVVQDIAREITIGGWPDLRSRGLNQALTAMQDYLGEICRVDVSQAGGARRDPQRVAQLMRSLARNVATSATATALARDTGGADGPLHKDTVRDYLNVLAQLMVIEDQPAWTPHMRSKYRLIEAAKRHFVDPALAVAAMGADPESLLQDLKLLGFLFESLVCRDLRVYSQACNGNVFHYRDNSGLEVDAIIQIRNGRWSAFEIKLGQSQVDVAATNLLKFASQVDTQTAGSPAALGVIVATGYGYTRKDGVHVIPIGALGP